MHFEQTLARLLTVSSLFLVASGVELPVFAAPDRCALVKDGEELREATATKLA